MLARNRIAILVVGFGIAVVTAYEVGTSDAVVERRLRAELAKYVRAPCTFESASFTFLHGLEVRGLTVLDPSDPLGPPLLAAERSRINYVLDVTGAGPRVTRIDIEKPRLRLERDADGTLPAQRAFFFPPPEGPAPPKPRVHLSGGEVTFADATILREPMVLHDIELDVAPAAAKAAEWARAEIHLTATSDVLGPISAEAKIGDAGTSGTVELELPRTRIEPSLPGRFAGDLGRRIADLAPTGEVSAHVTARLEEGKDFDADATVEVRDVALSVTLPESGEAHAPVKPIAVRGLSGRLHYADDRVEAHDLSFGALGAEIRVDATVDGVTQAAPRIDAKVGVAGLVLTTGTRGHLPSAARRILENYDITGDVAAKATVTGPLSSPDVRVEAEVARGHVRYDGFVGDDGVRYGFPWPVDEVAAKVSFDGRAVRVDATGRHGPAKVAAKVTVDLPPGARAIPDVSVFAEDVPLDDSLRRSFPDGGEEVFGKWGPSGVAKSVAVHVYRVPEVDLHHDVIEVTLECDGRAAFLPRILPVPLRDAKGRVEIREPLVDGRRTKLVRLTDVTGEADGFSIRVAGDVRDVGERHGDDLVVTIDTPDAGGPMRDAAFAATDDTIGPGVKDAIRKLGPSGPAHLVVKMVKPLDGARRDAVDITLLGAAVTGWDDIPLAARDLTGRVLVADDTLTCDGVAGFFVMEGESPAFTAAGRLLGLSGTPQFDVHVESPKIPLGEPLRKALGPLAKKAEAFWKEIDPAPGAHASLVLDLRPDTNPTPFEVTLDHIRGAMRPVGLELDCDEGTFHFDGRRAEMRGLDASIGAASVRVDEADVDVATGRVEIRAGVRGLHFPEDLEGPLSAQTVARIVETAPGRTMHALDVVLVYEPELRALEVAGSVSIRPRARHSLRDPGLSPEGILDVSRLVFYMPPDAPAFFQGEAQAAEFSLRAGLAIDRFKGPVEISGTLGDPMTFDLRTTGATLRLQEYPLTESEALVTLRPRGVHVDAKAKFMDGDLEGWTGPGKDEVSYQGEFTLQHADLEKIVRMRSSGEAEVASGLVDAKVQFQVVKGAHGGLRGAGKLTAYQARLMKSPGIGEIVRLATLGVYTPVLTDGELKFLIDGDWLDVKDVQVTGPGVQVSIVGGKGKIGLDGRLDLAVYPRVDIGLPGIDQIIRLLQGPVPMRQRVTGTLRNPHVEWEPVPRAETDRGREPQPEGDVEAPARDPW